ncbi:MAG TPA: 4Fe-4S dicluster domain-containing protein [Candidatus Methylomirabilis sp.]|nr:4Fe-4S dicluster domain-containing protein [Candidatus Methylomirabilis sp.]
MTTYAMFTDTSVCTGCRACQVACKQWNELPAEGAEWTGSYQNREHFSEQTWRLVRFAENRSENGDVKWLLMSDVCKHCAQAGCLEACPTGAIYRTEYGTVMVNQDICNGCRYCVSACPFGVIAFNKDTGRVNKCTFCNDRIHNNMPTACAKTCPTQSIQFGERGTLAEKAKKRLAELHKQGVKEARLYGVDEDVLGGLNAFYLLLDKPETYNLPSEPKLPQRHVVADSALSIGSALLLGVGALVSFRERGGRSSESGGEGQE